MREFIDEQYMIPKATDRCVRNHRLTSNPQT